MARKPKTPGGAPAWLCAGCAAYLALLAGLTLLNRLGADRCWPGALNLYLPQALRALPGLLLAAAALPGARRWLPLLGVAWVAGPLMGFCSPAAGRPRLLGGKLPGLRPPPGDRGPQLLPGAPRRGPLSAGGPSPEANYFPNLSQL